MRLADELLLLAYSDDGSARVGPPTLDLGLSGAVLLDLALTGRLDVPAGKVVVASAEPTGDPVLDDALSRIAGDDKARKPADWVQRLAKGLRERLLDGLVEQGMLGREADRVLWIFPRTRYPSAHGVEPPAEADARQRLATALDAPDPVDPRTAALAALVSATNLLGAVFPDRNRGATKKRIKALTEAALREDRWAAEGVRGAIEAVQAAVTATVVASTATTLAASS